MRAIPMHHARRPGGRARLVVGWAAALAVLAACAGPAAPSGSAGSPGPTPPAGTPAQSAGTPRPTGSPSAAPAGEVVLMTHDSFAISDATLEAFRAETGITVRVLRSGDAGAALNQAILTKDRPLADVFFGVDTTFLSRALDAGIFVPYRPARLAGVDPALQVDPSGRLTPVDYGDVCVNVDREAFGPAAGSPSAPTRLEDLAAPAYRGMLVVQNPATSSPGLAFMLATIDRFGESGPYTWLDYWRDLRANDVLVAAGWEDAYYGQFSGGSGEGERPLVVSYASSPVAEVYYADPQPTEAPTSVLTDGCFRQVEYVGILAGTQREAAARLLVDFLLGPTFQADIPLNMFVFPAVTATPLPDVFARHATIPTEPATLPADAIQQNRERWIEEWTSTVLR